MGEAKRKEERMNQPGLIAIVAGKLGRYRDFDQCLSKTELPEGTETEWWISMSPAHGLNMLVEMLLERTHLKWIWFLGDDHVWAPTLLKKLLGHGVQVASPLVTGSAHPFPLILKRFIGDPEGPVTVENVGWDFLEGKSGLLKLDPDLAVGNAGLLVQREVFEQIPRPWHALGQFGVEYGAPDLYLCKRFMQHKIPIHLDLDNTIGHMTHMVSFPTRQPGFKYVPQLFFVGPNPTPPKGARRDE